MTSPRTLGSLVRSPNEEGTERFSSTGPRVELGGRIKLACSCSSAMPCWGSMISPSAAGTSLTGDQAKKSRRTST